MMLNREKVIKGFETHIKPNSRCAGCPYPNNGLCVDQLYHDVLDLLKEQEQRINELEEKLRLLEYGDQDTLQSSMMPAT